MFESIRIRQQAQGHDIPYSHQSPDNRAFRVEVGDTCNQRSRITLMQVIEQLSQRRLLRIGIGVAGCLAVTGKPSHILHAYGEDILR